MAAQRVGVQLRRARRNLLLKCQRSRARSGQLERRVGLLNRSSKAFICAKIDVACMPLCVHICCLCDLTHQRRSDGIHVSAYTLGYLHERSFDDGHETPNTHTLTARYSATSSAIIFATSSVKS